MTLVVGSKWTVDPVAIMRTVCAMMGNTVDVLGVLSLRVAELALTVLANIYWEVEIARGYKEKMMEG